MFRRFLEMELSGDQSTAICFLDDGTSVSASIRNEFLYEQEPRKVKSGLLASDDGGVSYAVVAVLFQQDQCSQLP